MDANFNTIKNRSGRLLAGWSMGGYGAAKYAAAHNSLFSAVGVFSGGYTIRHPAAQGHVSTAHVLNGAGVSERHNYEPWPGSPWWNHQVPGWGDSDRVKVIFGPDSTWWVNSPIERVNDFAPYSRRLWIYAGPNEVGILGGPGIKAGTDDFHKEVGSAIPHQYCLGTAGQGHGYTSFADEL